jgi:hypothetical protein
MAYLGLDIVAPQFEQRGLLVVLDVRTCRGVVADPLRR